jgi:hypothetical protein
MRAKLKIESVTPFPGGETLKLRAVGKPGGYDPDGSDEDNTFATFTPTAELEMNVTNPALLGKFKAGAKYYVDFTPAD